MQPLDSPVSPRTFHMWADNLEKKILDLTAQVQALECDMLSPRTSTTDECVGISTMQNDPNIALTFDEWGDAKKESLDLKAQIQDLLPTYPHTKPRFMEVNSITSLSPEPALHSQQHRPKKNANLPQFVPGTIRRPHRTPG